jgi:iron(III) transport system ATP-binding protein
MAAAGAPPPGAGDVGFVVIAGRGIEAVALAAGGGLRPVSGAGDGRSVGCGGGAMEAVRVCDLWKRFDGVVAVHAVSFAVGPEEFFTLLGPSGCGKTTTLRCVAGLEQPTRGEIIINGRVVSGPGIFVPPERRRLGMVFQNYAVWPHMTVFDNIAYPLRVAGQSPSAIATRVAEIVDLVALRGLERRYPHQLSGGQQQRVALGRALAGRPDLLLLDEPLSNLDAKLREQMRFELKELQRRMKIPVLYVTHDQAEAMALSDRLAVMAEGRIVQIGRPADIYRQPATRFVADFIGQMNFLPAQVRASAAGAARVRVDGYECEAANPSGLSGAVTLAVRPEDLDLEADEGLAGRVEVRNFLGNLVEFKVRLANGTPLRVQAPPSAPYDEGATVTVGIRRGIVFAGGEEAPREPRP